jgi:hypothetical protein
MVSWCWRGVQGFFVDFYDFILGSLVVLWVTIRYGGWSVGEAVWRTDWKREWERELGKNSLTLGRKETSVKQLSRNECEDP